MVKRRDIRSALKTRPWTLWALCLTVAALTTASQAEDWTQFRGVDGSGKSDAKDLPATWDSSQNVIWKAALPGLGTSSPIILGSHVYLTCYSGYAESIENPGAMEELMRHLVCVDRDSGKILWSKEFKPKLPESEYVGGNSTRHGYASSTLTTDGEKLYAFFGASGVYGLDLDGNILWQTDVGSGTHSWGSATSPVLYKGLLIVNASIESESLVALDKDTGEEAWRTSGIKKCWSSPILVNVGGKQEVVLNVPNRLTAYDPASGKELWSCEGIPDGYVCPSVVAHDGVVFAIGGRKNTAIAVRAGGRGDVTSTHVIWRVGKGNNVTSPVYLDGHLYWFHESRGIAYCLDAKTGDVVYEEKLEPRPGLLYASITAADGKLYAPSQDNGTYVIAAKPQFKQLAVNQFQDDPSRTNAGIAVANGQLIMRTDRALYCLARSAK
jgi:outer membrane protein assembly factor BamB